MTQFLTSVFDRFILDTCVCANSHDRISYVHRVARFRMYEQIRAQTASFIRGFYSILNPDWLSIFSPPELQKLISGDSISVNIDDLK